MSAPIRRGVVIRVTTDERGPVGVIWVTEPVPCAQCHTAHVALRNRNGSTCCVACDMQKQIQEAA